MQNQTLKLTVEVRISENGNTGRVLIADEAGSRHFSSYGINVLGYLTKKYIDQYSLAMDAPDKLKQMKGERLRLKKERKEAISFLSELATEDWVNIDDI